MVAPVVEGTPDGTLHHSCARGTASAPGDWACTHWAQLLPTPAVQRPIEANGPSDFVLQFETMSNGIDQRQHPALTRLLPLPLHLEPRAGELVVTARTRLAAVGGGIHDHLLTHLVADLHRATGTHVSITSAPAEGDIVVRLDPTAGEHGSEGYALTVAPEGAHLVAATAAGLWNGSRTLLQLFPHVPGNSTAPAVHIVDRPRFEHRGAMLDVARHFFGPDHVMRFVELIARFKINRLHLHLTDDQGWRLGIDGWPTLIGIGASSSTGGDNGGHFTRDEYRELVAHAARHSVTIIPEIDMPGHTNAALASVPELNVDGVCPPMYTGKGVGFSSLRLAAPGTAGFIGDVIAQLAADTPGAWLHIGGDEAHSTDPGEYAEFIALLQRTVTEHGKQMIGWEEIATTRLAAGAIVQHWLHPATAAAAPADARFVMSPAAHTYLDMRHTPECPVGRRWAGFIDVDKAYDWDPATLIESIGDERILGVEAPLWTEKVRTFDEVDYLCFPRLACLAEVGWTAQIRREWTSFAPRLATHADRLADAGVHLFRSHLLG
jgi:hexosaminidase